MPAYLVPWLSNRTSREVGRAPRALRQGPHRAPAAAEAPPADPAQGAFGPELERAPAGPADMPPAAVGAPPPKRAPPSKCDAVAVGPCPTGCRYPAFSASGCRRHVSTSPATDRKHWGWRRRPWIWQRLHPSQITLLTLSLDPERDTPEAMREYVAAHGGRPGWTWLTGRREDIEAIRRFVGFTDRDPQLDADRTRHTTLVLLGNDPA